MSDLERNFKKQKFLEKIEKILDHDDENELISFFRGLLQKKGYMVQLETMYHHELKKITSQVRDDTIRELQHLDRDAIIGGLPPAPDPALTERSELLGYTTQIPETITLNSNEYEVLTFAKEFEVDIDPVFNPDQANKAVRSGLDQCMDTLIRSAIANGGVEVKKVYDPKSYKQRTTLTLKALKKS